MSEREIIIITYVACFKRHPSEDEIKERLEILARNNAPLTLPVQA